MDVRQLKLPNAMAVNIEIIPICNKSEMFDISWTIISQKIVIDNEFLFFNQLDCKISTQQQEQHFSALDIVL